MEPTKSSEAWERLGVLEGVVAYPNNSDLSLAFSLGYSAAVAHMRTVGVESGEGMLTAISAKRAIAAG